MKVQISIFISNFVVYVNVTRETGQKREGWGVMTETINATTDLQREKGENKLTPTEKKEI